MRVAWFALETLTQTVGKAKVDGSVARTICHICSVDLIVVDDIGMLPAGQDAAEAFYRVIEARSWSSPLIVDLGDGGMRFVDHCLSESHSLLHLVPAGPYAADGAICGWVVTPEPPLGWPRRSKLRRIG